MLNVAALEVRLGKDPELRYTQSGTPVCNLSGANNFRYNGKERTDWFSFVFWNKLAEIVAQFLKKGSRINISGRLQSRTWEDKDGNTRYVTEIRANDVSFLDPKSGDTVIARDEAGSVASEEGPADSEARSANSEEEDQVPF